MSRVGQALTDVIAQHMNIPINGVTIARNTGIARQRGFVATSMAVFSYAMIGAEKATFSDDNDPTTKNNVFFAAARELWPGDDSDVAFMSMSKHRSFVIRMFCTIRFCLGLYSFNTQCPTE